MTVYVLLFNDQQPSGAINTRHWFFAGVYSSHEKAVAEAAEIFGEPLMTGEMMGRWYAIFGEIGSRRYVIIEEMEVG
jgi:hypothetical protein